uniref:Protein grpE n=1 Tax=Lygus hesperus TaxID=30085 RepID=A0A146KX38_LYGHE
MVGLRCSSVPVDSVPPYPTSMASADMNNFWLAREPERMVGGERTRAYRYGMTLLCVGALFNWLGFSNGQSDPVKFIGYTCLASGALLLCMALCFWANSVQRPPNNQVRPEGNDFTVVNIMDPNNERYACEKPPDYNSVADLTPPPSYDDAIRLSPAYLQSQMGQGSGLGRVISEDLAAVHSPPSSTNAAQTSASIISFPKPENQTDNQSPSDNPKTSVESPKADSSALSRVIRLSSRLLRRTLSNVDDQSEAAQSTSRNNTIPRSRSDQDVKSMADSSASPI